MREFDHIVAALEASPVTRALAEMAKTDDFSSLESTAERHHYVPQFLLKGFAVERDGGRRIFQMPTSGRRAPTRVGVRDAALRRRLYTAVDDDGHASNRHEGYLALIEDLAAPALRRFIGDPQALTPGERASIAFLVAFQTMRTPVAAEQITALANMTLQNLASVLYSDRRGFAERHREDLDEYASPEEIDGLRLELLEAVRSGAVRASGNNGADFASGLRHAAETVPMIVAFGWLLLRAPSGGFARLTARPSCRSATRQRCCYDRAQDSAAFTWWRPRRTRSSTSTCGRSVGRTSTCTPSHMRRSPRSAWRPAGDQAMSSAPSRSAR
jgi:hypothetical protein